MPALLERHAVYDGVEEKPTCELPTVPLVNRVGI
jgi:hypothetical protein